MNNKRFSLRPNEKRAALTVIIVAVVVFLLAVFIVPELKVAEVVDGVALTGWQKFHGWFVDVKLWIVSNYYLLILLLAVLVILYFVRNKRYYRR